MDRGYDPNGDVSREFYEDYKKILNSIHKHKNQKVRDSPSSYERSTSQKMRKMRARSSSSGKKAKKSLLSQGMKNPPAISQY